MSEVDRFLGKISKNESGCHIWTGTKNKAGYGKMWRNGKKIYAHRFAWEMVNGGIPSGLHVCHHCDNPSCVNPDHLFVGTVADNMRDRELKGRGNHPVGENASRAKLKPSDVMEIRRSSLTQRKLAEIYGVAKSTIFLARKGINWSSIKSDGGVK